MPDFDAGVERLAAQALGRPIPQPIDEPRLESRVREAVGASGRKIVALDDDPTGAQTVHDIAVLAEWDASALGGELEQPESLFFVLTNSRSLAEQDAMALNREIATNLLLAGEETGVSSALLSRSDSTLRGHFPAETDELASVLDGVDGVLICPAFFEGGRVTAGDVHFVREGERLTPAAETEFARDATFGYRAATLPEWVEEKSGGRVRVQDVMSLSLEAIRGGGAEEVARLLRGVRGGRPVVVNALNYADLWTAVLGLLRVEGEGKRFLYRSGASFARARAGIAARPLLAREDLLGQDATSSARGVVIVGSHVRRTTEQLERLLALPWVTAIEVVVADLLRGEDAWMQEVERVSRLTNGTLAAGQTPVVFTSRAIGRPAGVDELTVARIVSAGLVAVAGGLEERPDFVVGKGGITSSDIGTQGLGARRALVLGQVRAGVPVWRLGVESRFPRMPYVVFPGNVGGPETLADIVRELVGESI